MKVLNEKDFDESVKSGVSLVDFYATWCMPCRMFADILEDVNDEIGDKINIFKVDVDESEKLARKFGIMSIPTVIIIKDGEMKEKHVGIWQKDDCVDAIKKYLN